jgi:hypothetical protein
MICRYSLEIKAPAERVDLIHDDAGDKMFEGEPWLGAAV